MAMSTLIVCLALVACVVGAPDRMSRYVDRGYNLGHGGGGGGGGGSGGGGSGFGGFGGFGGHGGHGGHSGHSGHGGHGGLGYGVPSGSRSFSKSSASASSVSGGVSLG